MHESCPVDWAHNFVSVPDKKVIRNPGKKCGKKEWVELGFFNR